MNIGRYRLLATAGGRFNFAAVVLRARVGEAIGVRIEFQENVDAWWRDAAAFGIRYAWRAVSTRFPMSSGLNVVVDDIQGPIVDTTEIGVVYAAAFALWEALDVQPDRIPEVDRDTGVFCFPPY